MPLVCLEPIGRRTTVAEVIETLVKVGQIDRRLIRHVELRGRQAVVEVPAGWENRLVQALDGALLGQGRVRAFVLSVPSRPISAHDRDHFDQLKRLLEMESKAEAERVLEMGRRLSPADAEKSGNTLLDLTVVDEESGLGGRVLIQLRKRGAGPLPWNRLDVGTPVLLTPHNSRDEGQRGVVCERSIRAITVAVSQRPDAWDDVETWRLDLSHDEVAHQRQKVALERVAVARGDRLAQLRDVLLGLRAAEFAPAVDETPLDAGLNPPQLAAVDFALSARDVALIHGPPGTGKTRAVVEVIRRAVRRGQKVLACAPSNMAVDNLLERLVAAGEQVVRLGHPARVLPELRSHTLDLMVDEHPDVRLAHKLVKEALALFRQSRRYTRAKPVPGQRQEMRAEAGSLLDDARRLELQAAENILNMADVVCATTTGLDSEILGPRRFDLAVIDEACQSTEPGCWVPLLRAERVVLAGDDCQLPPTVISEEAANEGFGVSLFERMRAMTGASLVRLLTIQYRMHEAIMGFSSAEFYEGRLTAGGSVAGHLLADLPSVRRDELTTAPIDFIDTAGAGFDEELEPDGESRLNRGEARLIVRKAKALLERGLAPEQMAVIAPYAAQVRLLREMLAIEGLEIDSVDGFQGREKEAVLISLVRSNPAGQLGFLTDVRRTNVALTRARRKLIVAGDSATLSNHPFYRRMLEYFEQNGAYRTVWEEGEV